MPERDQIWIVVHDDSSIEAFDHQHAAMNAARDDQNPWIELVDIDTTHPKQAPDAPVSDETGANAQPDHPTPQATAQRVTVPTSLGIPGWYVPGRTYDPFGGDAA